MSSIAICSPSSLAADSVITGTYFLYAATGRAVEHSEWAQRVIGLSVVMLCALLHGFFVRLAIRVQSALTVVKLLLLLLIVVVGVCAWAKGNGAPDAGFRDAFHGTSVHPSAYLSALFKVMFAYSGFNALNYSIDELKNPVRNLPRAALGGLLVTTVLYVASNAAYFLVLDPETVRRSSTAVAGVFFTNTLGNVWGQRIVPVLIGLATLGNVMCGVFAASRLIFEAAREGYLPGGRVLGEISRFQSPLAALAVNCLMTALFIVTPPAGEAYAFLIDIGVYPLWLFQGVAVIGLLVMRRTHRDLPRPFKAWHIANAVTIACAAFMLVVAFVKPSEDAAGTSGSIPYWAAPLTALAFIALSCGLWYIQIVYRRGLERSLYHGKHAGFG
ncbi:hypothetical protein H4R20_001508 [Coemansia guatemalensis]|uniref:Amino acid transporter n=1 Tax=Coemansia guatemalensis TaxID=2761395 RepID=A0A9W8LT59_9FUNG|nr:hypothetical protein H4R20_001508 [Coemansia guatemalensis]